MQSLMMLCQNNMTTQSQLFVGEGLRYFKKLNISKPLLGAVATTNIFKGNNKILYINSDIFFIILNFYKTKISNLRHVENF